MAWRRLASGTAATHLRRGVSSPPFAAPSRAFSAANPTRLLKAFGTGGSAIAVMIYPREVAQAAGPSQVVSLLTCIDCMAHLFCEHSLLLCM
nr:uncharacterized protein LOC127314848 isoform X4 [Lolium perenne]